MVGSEVFGEQRTNWGSNMHVDSTVWPTLWSMGLNLYISKDYSVLNEFTLQ